jgi:hydroxypyruvate reductase/glycerate 2-kinase
MNDQEAIATLRELFAGAVAAASPVAGVLANMPDPPSGRTAVISVGKAAITMAEAFESAWRAPLQGIAIAPHGLKASLKSIRLLSASHPVPDAASLAAAQSALDLASALGERDLLVALISGGGSSLMSKPAAGISPEEKREIGRALLKSGASIAELNCARKHISAVKGGLLARAAGKARIHTLILSDVPGDDPAIVASGPTVGDSTTKADALAILKRYAIEIPPSVSACLAGPAVERGPLRTGNYTKVIVSPHQSFMQVIKAAEAKGLNVLYLGDRIEGESREVAKVHAGIAQQIQQYGSPAAKPCLLLSGGETAVTVRGKGRGGRNVEFALAFAVAMAGAAGIYALAADSDGVDGMEHIAGAVVTPSTLRRARALGIDPIASLENNDGHGFFEALGDQVITGPTQTNINDVRAILIV